MKTAIKKLAYRSYKIKQDTEYTLKCLEINFPSASLKDRHEAYVYAVDKYKEVQEALNA